MNRFKLIIFLFVIALVSCQTKSNDKFTDTFSAGTIPVAADVSFESIIRQEIDVFHSQFPNAKLKPIFTNEVNAVDLLMKDSVRIAITTRPLLPNELAYLKSKKFEPKSYRMATDGIALIVNNSNPDTIISVIDIRRILTGEVTQWKQLFPRSALGRIRVVFDDPNSSTVRYAIDSICRGKALSEDLNAQHSNKEVIDYVSKTPNSIGIVSAHWIDNAEDSTHTSFTKSIRVMSVSNQQEATYENSWLPYQAYLYNGNYPLARNVYIILNDPKGTLPTRFSSFLSSDRGQRIILKTGLVPATQPIRVVSVTNENIY